MSTPSWIFVWAAFGIGPYILSKYYEAKKFPLEIEPEPVFSDISALEIVLLGAAGPIVGIPMLIWLAIQPPGR